MFLRGRDNNGTMASGILDLKRHGPNSFKLDGSINPGTAAQILDKLDDIRRAFRAVDPRGTGLVAEKDFKKVLYIEAGIAYNDVSIILATAPAKGGFVGYDTWIVDFLNKHQPADSSFRTQKPADPHPAQEIEEMKRIVVENSTNLLTALRMLDMDDTGFVPMQDFRGSLYLKLGLTSEQVDSIVCGVHEGQINYPEWISFFSTNPICTTTDIGQFIRYGGASTSGSRAPELKNDRYTVSDLGPQSLASVVGQPGVDSDAYSLRDQVSDIHTLETEDIRAQLRRREEEVMEELRKEALGRQQIEAVTNSPWTVQHTLAK
jgi:Ca2+-binding EF-hand superfamily protein